LDEDILIVKISEMLNVSHPSIYKVKYGGHKPKFNKKNFNFQIIRAVKTINKKGQKVTASTTLDLVSEPVTLRTL